MRSFGSIVSRIVLAIGLSLWFGACDDEVAVEETPLAVPADAAAGDGDAAKADEAAPAVEESGIASVDQMQGAVSIMRGEETMDAAAGTKVQEGDKIKTGADGRVAIAFEDESVLKLGKDSEITISAYAAAKDGDAAGRKGSFAVATGRFWAKISKWSGGGESSIEFSTPTAVAGIRGTTIWGDVKADAICALEGEVEIKSLKAKGKKAKPKKVKDGKCLSKMGKGKLKPLKVKPKQLKKYLAEFDIAAAEKAPEEGAKE